MIILRHGRGKYSDNEFSSALSDKNYSKNEIRKLNSFVSKSYSKSKYTTFLRGLIISYLILLLYFPMCIHGFCPSKCFCDDESLKVQCTNASLEIIPFLLNPEMKLLILPCNKIETIGQSLAFYPELKEIDISYNQIKAFEPQDFEAQNELKVLNLNNNKLNIIPNQNFLNLINLKELYLSSNTITIIQPNAFDNSFELRLLDLSSNKLKVLSDITFIETNNLEILNLNFNYFTNVPSNALHKLRSLKELLLTGNIISEVPRRAFRTLGNISVISLDKNNISVIYHESFEGMTQLKSLSMKDNRLTTLSGVIFNPINYLHNLELSGNLFEVLEKSSFATLSNLRHLRLSRCPRLYRIDSEAFSSLKSLETLKLSHNARLSYLGDSVFASLLKLSDLDLTACGLVYVHPDQMPRNPNARLHLAGNPFHCNCSLLWLASFTFNESFYFDTPTCATPANLYGIPVTEVDLRAAGCPQHLGIAAIGTCIGIILLSLLAAALFLAWRWRQRSIPTVKSLPVTSDTGLREPWSSTLTSNGHLGLHGGPIYAPKYCVPTPLPHAHGGNHQCQSGCQRNISQLPYAFHPVTRPLLTPPSPSINSQTHLPVDWFYPSPYDDDTHWYTTIGRDGREYLTGEPKRERPTPPPLPQDSPPPPPISSIPTSSPSAIVQLKRQNSFSGQRRTPVNAKRTLTPNQLPLPNKVPASYHTTGTNCTSSSNCTSPVFKLQEGVTLGDIARNPVTYI